LHLQKRGIPMGLHLHGMLHNHVYVGQDMRAKARYKRQGGHREHDYALRTRSLHTEVGTLVLIRTRRPKRAAEDTGTYMFDQEWEVGLDIMAELAAENTGAEMFDQEWEVGLDSDQLTWRQTSGR